ncbi:putative integral membrane protein [Hirsutella rhossiliensis]|uniref:Integral membrane protein n=1 Tax=Hirsutella rhossiliensis TaxID=111463 RepID=A0A9P8N933_9HYPO|nr:putative integral membrane protein [Hirsutella rhossiliensis]KAH0967994.1 putative integral membrane protein [Hirsutella rhossiliensis]
MSPRNFQFTCAVGGILGLVLALVAFIVSGFLPPISPLLDAEQTARHYRNHEKGIQAGAALIVVSGMFYILLTVAISAQMQCIPNLHYAVSALQLALGTAGGFAFLLPGLMLAVANYRLDRPVEITQTLNDMFWITFLLPWPTFMAQSFTIAYAIIIDSRPKPLFPKPTAILNIVAPFIYVLAAAVHCVKTGPMAWNGAVAFWIPLVAFGCQVVIDSICLIRALSAEPGTGGKNLDAFPTSPENCPDNCAARSDHNNCQG